MHSKEKLAEFIYELNKINKFEICDKFWPESVTTTGFIHDNSLPTKFMKQLEKTKLLSDCISSVICVLGDRESIAEGIVFTDKTIYVDSPNNTDTRFFVHYGEIKDLNYYPDVPILVIKTERSSFKIDTGLWNKLSIYDFLQFACEKYNFYKNNKEIIENIHMKCTSDKSVGAVAAGITDGNVSNASSIYFDDKILTPRGHGFAAEHANHLADLYLGKDTVIVGDDNALNGADRVVDGVFIQSKYCSSGARCVEECFNNTGFRYWNTDGTPMQIEVPSDMYEAAIQAMENRIRRGEVSGVTDPAEAKNIIRKGHFTYTQVKNIAKAGTVESICYDAASGAIIASYSFGVTAVVSFATALWSGDDLKEALKGAAAQGLKVGGVTFVTAVVSGQLSKAGLNSALIGSSEAIVQAIGPKASAVLVNAFRSGTNIYGAAAMKSAAKLLRSNAITAAVSFAVLSIGDVANIFQGRISGGQLFKNLTTTAAAIGGGTAGWAGGAAAGAAIGSVVPGIGTAIGGFVGGLIGAFGGGSIASKATESVLDQFIEDDANRMVAIIQDVFTELAGEYLTTQEEAERIVDKLKEKLTGGILKDMFANDDRKQFARRLLEKYFENESYNRSHITLPSQTEMQEGLKAVLEDAADSNVL